MRTSLQAIANKSKKDKRHRFQNLANMLTVDFLKDSWRFVKKSSAPGIDGRDAREFEKNLHANLTDLVNRLKQGRYRAGLIKRVYIPKGNGKLRPLGLPNIEDKILQMAVSRILSAIYEQDFIEDSFGYRPKRGAKQAVENLTRKIQFGRFTYVVEADIKGFFDNLNHDWLVKMLKLRIDDRVMIRLIEKWLKAGIVEPDGMKINPLTGTPQGGIISPLLANVYLHYALDLWFERVVKKHCQGEAEIIRYADDFICVFRYSHDADRFYQELGKRLRKFNLELATEKSGILKFSRFLIKNGKRFDFLGFEFFWQYDRNGKPNLAKRTSREKLRKSLKLFNEWARSARNFRMRKLFSLVNAKLKGYYGYYGVIGNSYSLNEFFFHAKMILYRWLNRRSQRKSFNLTTFKEILEYYQIARPRITQSRFSQYEFEM